ncbi:MAG: HEAT repeat domain-containing protein [Candidatus Cloacimonetes bacterium]|nr:HEAT repeat domain-containing protein [Candidatus Cloacimonadota bacterium]
MKKSFLIASIAIAGLTGCFSKGDSPYQEQLYSAESFFLNFEVDKSIAIIEELKSEKDLPDRYYSIAVKSYVRKQNFAKAFEVLAQWDKVSKKEHNSEYKEVLISYLRNFISKDSKTLKFEAIVTLGEIKDFASKKALMDMFSQKSRAIRVAVCYSLFLLGDGERALGYLKDRSMYSSLNSRFLASVLLTQLEIEALKDTYVQMLQDPEPAIQALAIKSLVALDLRDEVSKIETVYQESYTSQMKMLCSWAMAKMGKSSYKSVLKSYIKNEKTKTIAQLYLLRLGDDTYLEPVLSNLDKLDNESRFLVYEYLKDNNQLELVEKEIKSVLGDFMGDVLTKKLAIEMIIKHKIPVKKELLQSQLSSPFPEVRLAGTRALLLSGLLDK